MKSVDLRVLLNPLKIIPHFISRKNTKNQDGPIAVEFHWCTTCNYNCVHCSYAQRRKNFKILSQDVVEKTVKDLIDLDVKAVYFSGGGEPTTYKNWDRYAKEFLDNGVETALITNSIPLTNDHIDLLKRFNYIAVSVYSTNEDEYKKITGADNFDRQFALPEMLDSANSNVIVGARCVINNINYNKFKKIKESVNEKSFNHFTCCFMYRM